MTKLLERVIEDLRTLPEEDQDFVADLLINLVAKRNEPIPLDDETGAAVREGLAQAKRGEIASDEEVAAFFARHRR